ncbi:MAG: hypothetical protein WC955_00900 [Elusimicrobiota bacterium]
MTENVKDTIVKQLCAMLSRHGWYYELADKDSTNNDADILSTNGRDLYMKVVTNPEKTDVELCIDNGVNMFVVTDTSLKSLLTDKVYAVNPKIPVLLPDEAEPYVVKYKKQE